MSQMQMFSSSPVRVSEMIGTSVTNPRGDDLGNIKEVVVDPRTGRVAYAVVAFGGFLGLGEKLFAIPYSAFQHNVTRNEYVLDCTPERLKTAPGFDADNWPRLSDEKWNREVYEHFGRSPYWE